jgi:hypothetical protein
VWRAEITPATKATPPVGRSRAGRKTNITQTAALPSIACHAAATSSGVLAVQRAVGNAAATALIHDNRLQRQQTATTAATPARPAGVTWITELAKQLVQARNWKGALAELDEGHGIREALSVAICETATDAELLEMASDSTGHKLLFRMVGLMQGFFTSEAEKTQLARAMTAITRSQGAVPVTIEVITFRSGFAPLDIAGQAAFGRGAKGHTAVVVADLVYSFDEHGWVMGGSKAEYLARNTYRDAIGQVLRVNAADALAIQDGLNRSVGHGSYYFGSGQVCTDAAASHLARALGQINAHHNPQHFADMLEASGFVVTTHTYPRGR